MLLKKPMPAGVVQVRNEICNRCANKCSQFLEGKIDHKDPCAQCPATPRMWGVYGRCESFGLGDAVASIAQPIAKAIDAVAGTNVQNCGGCKKRQEALNKMVPNL